MEKGKKIKNGKKRLAIMAPRAGLEPATYWLTANRSAD
jgi:hypothetical protein